MELNEKQWKFTRMVARLIQHANSLGYEISFGDAYATMGHKKYSNHYIRLAIDINLFWGGKYLKRTEDHLPLGEWWESQGGSWGGRFSDGNHYSLEYRGRK